jgi:hypothetical protein
MQTQCVISQEEPKYKNETEQEFHVRIIQAQTFRTEVIRAVPPLQLKVLESNITVPRHPGKKICV